MYMGNLTTCTCNSHFVDSPICYFSQCLQWQLDYISPHSFSSFSETTSCPICYLHECLSSWCFHVKNCAGTKWGANALGAHNSGKSYQKQAKVILCPCNKIYHKMCNHELLQKVLESSWQAWLGTLLVFFLFMCQHLCLDIQGKCSLKCLAGL